MARGKRTFTLPTVSAAGLKRFAFANMLIWLAGLFIFEKGLLHGNEYSLKELQEMMGSDAALARTIILAIALQMIGGIAFPVYAYLTVMSFEKTKSVTDYLGKIAMTAILTEAFWDYAMEGSFFSLETQNPLFTVILSVVCLIIMKYIDEKVKDGRIFYKLGTMLISILWAMLLRTYGGTTFILLVSVFYLLKDKNGLKCFLGMMITIAGPFLGHGSFLGVVSFYGIYCFNGKEREMKEHPAFYYIATALAVVVLGLIARLAF